MVGKVDFWQPQATFLELVILKNMRAIFLSVSFYKISWKIMLTVLYIHPRGCPTLGYMHTLTVDNCVF